MRKNILSILAVVMLLVIILLGFCYIRNQKEFNSETLDAVPISSECVLQFSSLDKFQELLSDSKSIVKDINRFKGVMSVKSIFDSICRKVESNSSFSDIKTDKSFVCATKLTGKSDVELLFVFPVNNYNEQGQIKDFLKDVFKGYLVNNRKYSGEIITSYVKGNKQLHTAFIEGLLLLSESTIFVEDAIRQMSTTPKLRDIEDFKKVQKTASSNSEVNIFINNVNISRLLMLVSAKEYKDLFSSFSSLASWTSLDLDVDNNYIQLNGFSKTGDKRFDMFDMFVNQQPVSSQLINIIPSGVAAFSLFCLSDIQKFREDYGKYLNQTGRLRNYRKGMGRLKILYGEDFEDVFYSFFEGEAAVVSLAVNNLDINKDKLAIFRTKGSSMVKDNMLKMLNNYAKQNMKPLSYYKKEIVIDRDKSFDIYNTAVNDIPYKLFGDLFSQVPANYFMVVDNYLIFGGSQKVLSDFLHSYVLNKGIKSDILYKDCSQLFASKGNYKFYSNTSSALPLLTNYFSQEVKDMVNKNKENISKFYSTCYQFSSANNMIFNNLFFMYSESLKERPHTIWESGLDAGVKMKPVIVNNHNTSEKEILVQDENNNLYLLNSLGRVLWKVPIDGEINSEVYQVDKYRNNKLQYLFSTRNKIFLVDRNGNHVGRFPVILKNPSEKGISVFDYDLNRKYRIFVPCSDKKVYLYDIDGNIVNGWETFKTDNNIITKVNHYRIGEKDFIVFADEFKVYLLDRRGRIRSKTDKYFSLSKNAEFVAVNASDPQNTSLLVTDIKGDVYKIGFNGKIIKFRSFAEFSPQHRFYAEDLDGDNKMEYIFCDGNKLKVFNDKENLIDFEVEGRIEGVPNIFSFGWNNKKIGILDGDNDLIYLINNNGDVYNGFPVQGKSPFSISFMKGKNSGFNMFVGSSGTSLFNYKVQS